MCLFDLKSKGYFHNNEVDPMCQPNFLNLLHMDFGWKRVESKKNNNNLLFCILPMNDIFNFLFLKIISNFFPYYFLG